MPADARKLELLEIGARIFSELPYQEVTVADAASRAGVSKGLVFRYFSSKREYYVESLRTAVENAIRATGPDPSLDAHTRFQLGLEQWIAVAEHSPYLLPSIDHGEAARDPEVREIVDRALDTVAQRMIERMGAEPTPEIKQAVLSYIHYVRSATMEWLEGQRVSRQQLIDTLSATFRAVIVGTVGEQAARRLSLP